MARGNQRDLAREKNAVRLRLNLLIFGRRNKPRQTKEDRTIWLLNNVVKRMPLLLRRRVCTSMSMEANNVQVKAKEAAKAAGK